MTDLTPDRIAAIRERCEKATPGEWYAQDCGPDSPAFVEVRVNDAEGPLVAETFTGGSAAPPFANAEFIAHARADVPDLLSILAAANARLAETAARETQAVEAASRYEREVVALCARIAELEDVGLPAQLEQAHFLCEKLRARAEKAEADAKSDAEALDRLTGNFDRMCAEVREAKGRVERAEADLATSEEERRQDQCEVGEWRDRAAEEQKRKDAEAALASVHAAIGESSDSDDESLGEVVGKIWRELHEVAADREAVRKALAEAEAEFSDALTDESRKLHLAGCENDELRVRIAALEKLTGPGPWVEATRLHDAEQRVSALESRLAAVTAERDDALVDLWQEGGIQPEASRKIIAEAEAAKETARDQAVAFVERDLHAAVDGENAARSAQQAAEARAKAAEAALKRIVGGWNQSLEWARGIAEAALSRASAPAPAAETPEKAGGEEEGTTCQP